MPIQAVKIVGRIFETMDHQYPWINESDIPLNNESTGAIPQSFWSFDYLLLAVMISVLSVVGIIGNIPVLIVYFRRTDQKASNTFIKILAFLDLLVCAFIMPYSIIYELHLVTDDVVCRSFELVRHFTVGASNMTLVAIAAERYIAVCQIGTKINVRSINHGLCGILVASLLTAAPSVGIFAVVNVIDISDIPCSYPHELTSGTFCHFTYTIMGKSIVTAYQGFLMVMFCIVLLIIVVLYTIVYIVLWNKTKIRRKLTKRRESSITSTEYPAKETERKLSQQILSNEKDDSSTGSMQTFTLLRLPQTINITPNNNCSDNEESGYCEYKVESKVTFQPESEKLTVTTDNNGVIIKPDSKKKKLNISFGSASKPQERTRKRRHYHRRTAKMLFLCTVIYFVTWLPFWLDIFRLSDSLLLRYMFFIGNATNPIIYGIVNVRIRRSFKRLILECARKWCRLGKKQEDDFDLNGSTSLGNNRK